MVGDSTPKAGTPGFVDEPRASWMKVPAIAGPAKPSGSPLPPIGSQPALPPPPIGETPPQESDTLNWLGGVSLRLVFFGGLPGLISGLLGLWAVKKGKATNRGEAVVGVVMNGLVFGLLAIAIGASVLPGVFGPERTEELSLGDCFDEPEVVTQSGTDVVEMFTLRSCDEPHFGEVYYVGTLTDTAYPRADEVAVRIDEQCYMRAETHLDLNNADATYYSFYYPTRQGFAAGQRSYECFVYADQDIVGSVRPTG
ncbi:MAG: hypothetical protein CVT64_02375 [Actinobacteria bacterium HGW-Actinobacteria-4]|nr:MAG: hypothetical protein CVT64_02375 [Actinobacteria bacterium HGW-Actinobacteria-4]